MHACLLCCSSHSWVDILLGSYDGRFRGSSDGWEGVREDTSVWALRSSCVQRCSAICSHFDSICFIPRNTVSILCLGKVYGGKRVDGHKRKDTYAAKKYMRIQRRMHVCIHVHTYAKFHVYVHACTTYVCQLPRVCTCMHFILNAYNSFCVCRQET